MALNTLIHVSQDERERAINMSRRKWRSDYESDMATSREIMRMDIARNMLTENMDINLIAKLTGLTQDEIMRLDLNNE